MVHVRFGDVVKRANTKVDKDNTTLEYYVGGEHVDSCEFSITKRGIIKGSTIGPMFYFGFKAGDVLIVSRNPHLKKAGMVSFDGICSEKTFVVETKDNNVLRQDYLPFIVQNPLFWEYAETNKSGSVNFFINWSTLERYEFDLPPIEEQKRLAEILWAAEDEKQAINSAIITANKLIQSLSKKYFTKGIKTTVGKCVTKIIGGGTPSRSNEAYYTGNIPWATVKDISETDKYKFRTQEYITEDALKNSASNLIEPNNLIIATRISLDRQFINMVPMAINQDLRALYPAEGVNVEFLYYWFKAHYDVIYNNSSGTTVRGILIDTIRELEINLPDIDIQKKMVNNLTHLTNTITNLSELLKPLTKLQYALINEKMPSIIKEK